jgi:hypothetical protein
MDGVVSGQRRAAFGWFLDLHGDSLLSVQDLLNG